MSDDFKYLAIKNWAKYQPTKTLKYKDAKLPWVKDYTNKIDDYDFAHLTMFERGLLDELCRMRGRTACNLPNDPIHIARATQTLPKERHCIPQAIRKLTAFGFLIPTNQQVDYRERERETVTSSPETENSVLTDGINQSSNPASNPATTERDGTEEEKLDQEIAQKLRQDALDVLRSSFPVADATTVDLPRFASVVATVRAWGVNPNTLINHLRRHKPNGGLSSAWRTTDGFMKAVESPSENGVLPQYIDHDLDSSICEICRRERATV